MKNLKYTWLLLLLVLSSLGACSDNDPLMPEDPPATGGTDPKPEEQVLHNGFNFTPTVPKADEALTITFKAPEGSSFYGYKNDLYLHSGAGANWTGAPTWGDNQDKYKLKKIKDNIWSITLPASIRSFYAIPSSVSLQTLNLIVRDAESKNQTYDYATLVEDSRNGFTWSEPQKAPLPISGEYKEGIHINSATSVTLALYDKDNQGGHKDCVFVVGSFNNWKLDSRYMMKYDEINTCWWITLDGLTAGEVQFQYFVYSALDGGTYLCDPYCEKALEKGVDTNYPANAQAPYVSVVNTNPQPYQWTVSNFKMTNKDNPVIYELLLRDFTSGGNLAGATAKLSYLKELGVDAIELMPVQEFSGSDSWGYNTGLYFALDGSYGTLNEYKAFIDACHANGMAVIFDVVYNHTNNDNPFARMYWDAFNNRPSATNPWLNAVTPHQKYVFSPDDFNHSSEQTKAFVKRNLKYLIDTYRIDGFRFDFTKGFTQKKTTGDDDLAATDPARVAVLKEYYDAVKAAKADAIVIMEHFCANEETTLANSGICFWRNMNYAYCQSAMGWADNSAFNGLYDTTYPEKFVGYMESHDEERCAYKQKAYGNGVLKTDLTERVKQLSSNAAFFFTVPGPKMLWQFGEMGYDISIDENGRTGKKPLHWEYLTERKALVDTYTKLINLRTAYPELFNASAQLVWEVGNNVWSNGRTLTVKATNGKQLHVYGNFTAGSIDYTIPTGTWYTYLETGSQVQGGAKVSVPAHEFRLYTSFAK